MSAIFNIASRPAALAVARVLNPNGGQWTGSLQTEHSKSSIEAGVHNINRNAHEPSLTAPQHASPKGDSPSRELRDFSLFRRSSVPAPAFWLREQARGLGIHSTSTLQSRLLAESTSENISAPAAEGADEVNWDYWHEARSSYSSAGSDDFNRLECVADDSSVTASVHAPYSADEYVASTSNGSKHTSKLDANFDNTSMAFLGSGAFGSVIRATSKCDGQTYAVKVVLMSFSEHEENEQPEYPHMITREEVDPRLGSFPNRNKCDAGQGHAASQSAFGQNSAVDKIKSSTNNGSSTKHGENEREWALGEARAMASIAPHPHIVRYFGSWVDVAPNGRLSSVSSQVPRLSSTVCRNITNGTELSSALNISGGYNRSGSLSSLEDTKFKPPVEVDSDSDTYSKCKALHIQMAVCEGPTLADWLADRRAATTSRPGAASGVTGAVEELLAFRQVVCAVSHVHSQGWAHLDLTPRNVFGVPLGDGKNSVEMQSESNLEAIQAIDNEKVALPPPSTPELMHWCLGDFSFARPLLDGLDSTSPAGTYLYAAPELVHQSVSAQTLASNAGTDAEEDGVNGIGEEEAAPKKTALDSLQPVGSAADIFSLGVMLVECCLAFSTGMERAVTLEELHKTGRSPHSLGDVFIADASNGADSPNAKVGITIRAALRVLVDQMVSLNWSARPTAHEVLVALDNVIQMTSDYAAAEHSAKYTVSSTASEERGSLHSAAEEMEDDAEDEVSSDDGDNLKSYNDDKTDKQTEGTPSAWETLYTDLKTARAQVTDVCAAAAETSPIAQAPQVLLGCTSPLTRAPIKTDLSSVGIEHFGLADMTNLRDELRRWRELLNGPDATAFLG